MPVYFCRQAKKRKNNVMKLIQMLKKIHRWVHNMLLYGSWHSKRKHNYSLMLNSNFFKITSSFTQKMFWVKCLLFHFYCSNSEERESNMCIFWSFNLFAFDPKAVVKNDMILFVHLSVRPSTDLEIKRLEIVTWSFRETTLYKFNF